MARKKLNITELDWSGLINGRATLMHSASRREFIMERRGETHTLNAHWSQFIEREA